MDRRGTQDCRLRSSAKVCCRKRIHAAFSSTHPEAPNEASRAGLRENPRKLRARAFAEAGVRRPMTMKKLSTPSRFRKCCIQMTYNETRQKAIPHQDNRSLSGPAGSCRRGRPAINKKQWRHATLSRRFRHGIVRAIEGLRGVRLPLVPGPGTQQCVLQEM